MFEWNSTCSEGNNRHPGLVPWEGRENFFFLLGKRREMINTQAARSLVTKSRERPRDRCSAPLCVCTRNDWCSSLICFKLCHLLKHFVFMSFWSIKYYRYTFVRQLTLFASASGTRWTHVQYTPRVGIVVSTERFVLKRITTYIINECFIFFI